MTPRNPVLVLLAALALAGAFWVVSFRPANADPGRTGPAGPARMAPAGAIAADVVVRQLDDGLCIATDGRRVIARDADASTVIQGAIDHLPDTGGFIQLAAGRYELTRTVVIRDKHGVRMEGAARGITFSGGQSGTTLRAGRPIDLIHIVGDEKKLAGVSLANMNLIGSGKDNGKVGVLVDGATDLLSLHQLGVNHCGTGIHLRADPSANHRTAVADAPQIQFCDPQVCGTGLRIERCHYGKIVGGEFSDCDEYGIVLSSPQGGGSRAGAMKIIAVTAVRNQLGGILVGASTEDTTISGGCDFSGSAEGAGILITDEGTGLPPTNVIIDGNHLYNNKVAGVRVEQAEHVIIANNICSGHDHVVVTDHGQRHGIFVGKDANDAVVTGNLCYGNGGKGIRVESANATATGNRQ